MALDFSLNRFSAEERPPVPDAVIGRLYRATDVADVVASFSEEQRAALALFCYGRSHLRDIGKAVAATCNAEVLHHLGGRLGTALFAESRNAPVNAGKQTNYRPISLALPRPVPPSFEAFKDPHDEVDAA